MLLYACQNLGDMDAGILRWSFNIHTAKEMVALGAVFARAVLPRRHEPEFPVPWQNGTLRIGLESKGARDAGKSTFAKGMLETIQDKICVEKVVASKDQTEWLSPRNGAIRHYDTYCGFLSGALISYSRNDPFGCGLPRTDIVEHAHNDRNDTGCNYLVYFQRLNKETETRIVTFAATADAAHAGEFQDLVDQYSRLSKKSVNDNAHHSPQPQAGMKCAP